jgi:hypothetical protein
MSAGGNKKQPGPQSYILKKWSEFAPTAEGLKPVDGNSQERALRATDMIVV